MTERSDMEKPARAWRALVCAWTREITEYRLAIGVLAILVAVLGASMGYWLGNDDGQRPATLASRAVPSPPQPETRATVEARDEKPEAVAPAIVAALPSAVAAPAEPASEAAPLAATPEPTQLAALSEAVDAAIRPYATKKKIIGIPPWRRFAVSPPAAVGEGRPLIALVLDDLGPPHRRTLRAIALPGPLTLAFLPYADDLPALTVAAHEAGHELLVHLPMEPLAKNIDTGPNAVMTGLREDELRELLDWNLSRFEGYVGLNNHMGSRLSLDAASMAILLAELRDRGLLFLDSRTTSGSFGWRIAREIGVPYAKRDVFIDNDIEAGAIGVQLAELEERARTQGYAIGIGHPHGTTLDVLENWLPRLAERGFVLVPLSTIVARARDIDLARQFNAANGVE